MKKKFDTKYLVTLAMLCAIVAIMGLTRIGFISLPLIKATTMHIPVIIGAIILGPNAGAVLGAIFGLCSIWANLAPDSVLSFVFNPFMSTEGFLGVCKSLWVALGCRIIFGYLTGWIWRLFHKAIKKDLLSLTLTATLSSITHTILVMGSIYGLFAARYAQEKNIAYTAVFGTIIGIVTTSGVAEAILAGIVVSAICVALFKVINRTPMGKGGN